MKKLLSVFCSVLCIHSIAQPPIDSGKFSLKNSGEKVLMKAIAGFVNPEANKKKPSKNTRPSSVECP